MQHIAQMLRIDLRHVGEAGAPVGVVRTDQRIEADGVDVVAQDDEVAGTQGGIESARRIGEQDLPAAHSPGDFDGEHDRLPTHALVPVTAAAECEHAFPAAFVEAQLTGMADHRRGTEAGDVRVGDAHQHAIALKGVAPAAAKHDGEVRRTREAGVGERPRRGVKERLVHSR